MSFHVHLTMSTTSIKPFMTRIIHRNERGENGPNGVLRVALAGVALFVVGHFYGEVDGDGLPPVPLPVVHWVVFGLGQHDRHMDTTSVVVFGFVVVDGFMSRGPINIDTIAACCVGGGVGEHTLGPMA